MASPARVLLGDDHALVGQGVRLILAGEPGLTVVAQAWNGGGGGRAGTRA